MSDKRITISLDEYNMLHTETLAQKDTIARLTAEVERLRAALQGVLWMAEECFKHDGSDATFDDDYKQELDATNEAHLLLWLYDII